jgi:hypothetical protein
MFWSFLFLCYMWKMELIFSIRENVKLDGPCIKIRNSWIYVPLLCILHLNSIYTVRPLYSLANLSFNGIPFLFRNIALWIPTPRAGLYTALPVVVVTVLLVFKSLAIKYIHIYTHTLPGTFTAGQMQVLSNTVTFCRWVLCAFKSEYIGANSHRSWRASKHTHSPTHSLTHITEVTEIGHNRAEQMLVL